ncbi:GNAT family N-acetyltransferase [Luteolibacter arcticus]|uniref:GNAT family N-acetyltransferase n=1 Tax=Luteolibacter arcticus TaxID=1581411 RepID=A0ABT3GCU5_9BACT|nr:GNAT family N-acetyltransferase [Luteolibacter arcticus]MCW1921125.1 GNAT family N-acetyltransferase [Luteolibacter arcticus]
MKLIYLKTNRLVLRPPVPEDASAIQRYVGDRRIAETTALIPHPYPAGGAIEWIRHSDETLREGGGVNFSILLRESGELVGVVGLIDRDEDSSLGYWIGVPHWGKGYATEAVHRVIRHAFNARRLPSVHAYHFVHNPASGRVMQKAGLLYEGVQPLGASRLGERYDRVCYGVTAEQWRANLRTFSLV